MLYWDTDLWDFFFVRVSRELVCPPSYPPPVAPKSPRPCGERPPSISLPGLTVIAAGAASLLSHGGGGVGGGGRSTGGGGGGVCGGAGGAGGEGGGALPCKRPLTH